MVMSKTRAVEVKTQAVSPVSRVGSSSAGAAASTGAASAIAAVVSVVFVVSPASSTRTISSVGVVAVAASSAHATEPPKRAPAMPNASSIFFIRIPQPSFCELLGTQQTSCQVRQRLHLFHLYEYG